MKRLLSFIFAFIVLSACDTGTSPPVNTVPSLSGTFQMFNDTGFTRVVKVTPAPGSIGSLTITDDSVAVNVTLMASFDWDADWQNSVAGESQPLYVEIYDEPGAEPPPIWNGNLNVYDGISTLYNLSDYPE